MKFLQMIGLAPKDTVPAAALEASHVIPFEVQNTHPRSQRQVEVAPDCAEATLVIDGRAYNNNSRRTKVVRSHLTRASRLAQRRGVPTHTSK